MHAWQMKAASLPPFRAHVTDFHSCIRKRAGPPSVNVTYSGLQCGGRGIVEIYNCSPERQKWSHEIGQIAFLVNGRNEAEPGQGRDLTAS